MPSNAEEYDDEGSSLFCFHSFPSSPLPLLSLLTPSSAIPTPHLRSSPRRPAPRHLPSGEERGKEGGLGHCIIVAGRVLIVYVTGVCVGGGIAGKQIALECSVFSPNGTVWWRIQGSWLAAVSCF